MNLPKQWDEITVGQFQGIYEVLVKPCDNEDDLAMRHIQLLAAVTGMGDTELNALPLAVYAKAMNDLQWIIDIKPLEKYAIAPVIKLNGVTYTLCTEVSKLSSGQFIDLTSFTKRDSENMANLHNIIAALLVRPGKKYEGDKHADVAACVQAYMPITQAYPFAVFFSKLLDVSSDAIRTCLEKQAKRIEKQLLRKQKRVLGKSRWMPFQKPTRSAGAGI